MNRLRLSGEEQSIRMAFGNTDIVGTGADEIISLNIGIGNVSVNIGGGDAIYFGNSSDQYDIVSAGGNVVEVKDQSDNKVTISVGGTGKIGFSDGQADLKMEMGFPKIGHLNITTEPVDLTELDFETLPTEIEAGYVDEDFINIIDGGYANSVFVQGGV